MVKVLRLILFTGVMLFLNSSLWASTISVQPLLLNLTKHQQYASIEVANTGNTTAYVTTKASRVENPGMPNQQVLKLVDNPEAVGIVAVPNKLIIPKQQMRIIHVYLLHPGTSKVDQIYHLLISPVEGNLVASQSAVQNSQQAHGGLRLIMAYEVKVFVRPDNAKPNMVFIRQGKQLTVINKGNTNALLTDAKQCLHSACHPLNNLEKRLYVGNRWQISLPYNAPISFTQIFNERQSTVSSL